jgi:hypothetical protein
MNSGSFRNGICLSVLLGSLLLTLPPTAKAQLNWEGQLALLLRRSPTWPLRSREKSGIPKWRFTTSTVAT